jgi:hypothetical protein
MLPRLCIAAGCMYLYVKKWGNARNVQEVTFPSHNSSIESHQNVKFSSFIALNIVTFHSNSSQHWCISPCLSTTLCILSRRALAFWTTHKQSFPLSHYCVASVAQSNNFLQGVILQHNNTTPNTTSELKNVAFVALVAHHPPDCMGHWSNRNWNSANSTIMREWKWLFMNCRNIQAQFLLQQNF